MHGRHAVPDETRCLVVHRTVGERVAAGLSRTSRPRRIPSDGTSGLVEPDEGHRVVGHEPNVVTSMDDGGKRFRSPNEAPGHVGILSDADFGAAERSRADRGGSLECDAVLDEERGFVGFADSGGSGGTDSREQVQDEQRTVVGVVGIAAAVISVPAPHVGMVTVLDFDAHEEQEEKSSNEDVTGSENAPELAVAKYLRHDSDFVSL